MSASASIFEGLRNAFDNGRLSHGLVLSVPDATAPEWRKSFKAFLAALLCLERKKGAPACARCASCRLLAHETEGESAHPDCLELVPAENGNFEVDQVRDLLKSFSLVRSISPNRVAWIQRADGLSAQGGAPANALLKILEEPRPQTYFLLTTSRPDALLATIRSRCQMFRFPPPAAEPVTRLPEDLQAWEPLLQWLRQGSGPAGARLETPADSDSFWKERDAAIAELGLLYAALWRGLEDRWGAFDRDAAYAATDFFLRFEELLKALKGYGNPGLQWLSFRTSARLN